MNESQAPGKEFTGGLRVWYRCEQQSQQRGV